MTNNRLLLLTRQNNERSGQRERNKIPFTWSVTPKLWVLPLQRKATFLFSGDAAILFLMTTISPHISIFINQKQTKLKKRQIKITDAYGRMILSKNRKQFIDNKKETNRDFKEGENYGRQKLSC
ncbi:MAG: hypothetical protein ACM3SY_10810 [Candidatus Omnitrophota bacterium]